MCHFSSKIAPSFIIIALPFLLLSLCPKVSPKSAEFGRRLYAFQREVSEPDQRKSVSKHQQKICINGKTVLRKCVCKLDYFGEHCERKMFCKGFERESNLSCVQCNDNYAGDRCDQPKCRNGGEEHPIEQHCQCPAPYSGDFCETLKMEDVYRFYNTKAALVGPLGILTVIPMLFCFYMCEKKARIRQVNRIQKSWSEQRKASIQSAQIASLLAEKA